MFALQVPARQSLIPDLVGKKLVTNAIGLNAMQMGVTTMIAPAIGGYTYEFFGPLNSYVIVSILMTIGVIFQGFVPNFPPKLKNKISKSKIKIKSLSNINHLLLELETKVEKNDFFNFIRLLHPSPALAARSYVCASSTS